MRSHNRPAHTAGYELCGGIPDAAHARGGGLLDAGRDHAGASPMNDENRALGLHVPRGPWATSRRPAPCARSVVTNARDAPPHGDLAGAPRPLQRSRAEAALRAGPAGAARLPVPGVYGTDTHTRVRVMESCSSSAAILHAAGCDSCAGLVLLLGPADLAYDLLQPAAKACFRGLRSTRPLQLKQLLSAAAPRLAAVLAAEGVEPELYAQVGASLRLTADGPACEAMMRDDQ
jgi:hypothetical protein